MALCCSVRFDRHWRECVSRRLSLCIRCTAVSTFFGVVKVRLEFFARLLANTPRLEQGTGALNGLDLMYKLFFTVSDIMCAAAVMRFLFPYRWRL